MGFLYYNQNMARFDLHLHSSYSDGSDNIHDLLNNIIKSGIQICALTDHDTVAGLKELEQIVPSEITFIKGVELTCSSNGLNCHILGYNCDYNNQTLSALIEKGKKLRRQKLETRINYLKEVHNIDLTTEEKEWLYSRTSVVKTHIANVLVKRGLTSDNVSAMKQYLDDCKTGKTKFEIEEAIDAIKSSGGIPVWAHPLGGEGEKHDSEEIFLPKLEIMKNYGIQGLECYYSRYNDEESDFLVQCAKANNLLISGGSDYHGTNKDIPIGRLNSSDKYIDSSNVSILQSIIF
jgi:predicted metal-dependent phosphoesterase TrpH